MTPHALRVVPVTALPPGFRSLRDAADTEGYHSMRRLETEVADGAPAFELLLAVYAGDDLVAVGD